MRVSSPSGRLWPKGGSLPMSALPCRSYPTAVVRGAEPTRLVSREPDDSHAPPLAGSVSGPASAPSPNISSRFAINAHGTAADLACSDACAATSCALHSSKNTVAVAACLYPRTISNGLAAMCPTGPARGDSERRPRSLDGRPECSHGNCNRPANGLYRPRRCLHRGA